MRSRASEPETAGSGPKIRRGPRFSLLPRSGHYVHMDKPQELVQVVTKFLHEAA